MGCIEMDLSVAGKQKGMRLIETWDVLKSWGNESFATRATD